MSGQSEPSDSVAPKRRWVAPTLTAYASLAALTQMQYPQDVGADSAYGYGGPQRAVPCSQGFCP
jgi:hypothetical protein